MTVFPLRSLLSSLLWEKLFAHLFDKTADDYMISHMTSPIQIRWASTPSRPLVVDELTCFYNSKSSSNGSASLFGRQGRSSLFFFVSTLRSALSLLRCLPFVMEDLPLGPPLQAVYLHLLPLLWPRQITFSKSSCGLVSKKSKTRL